MTEDIKELQQICRDLRTDVVSMITLARSGHPGGSLSCVEILAALYFNVLRVDPMCPSLSQRDRFVLSKGHAAPAYYAALARKGYFSADEYKRLRRLGSMLQGHPDRKRTPGVDASTGSLGQGAAVATGMALGLRHQGNSARVYALLGDGEMQEGIVWETMMAAAHFHLDNLTFIVDNNGLQIDGKNDDVMRLGDICEKATAFGWDAISIPDGNNLKQVLFALHLPPCPGKPRCIVAHTVKGKGVSFMENEAGWHGRAPSAEECSRAKQEIGGVAHA